MLRRITTNQGGSCPAFRATVRALRSAVALVVLLTLALADSGCAGHRQALPSEAPARGERRLRLPTLLGGGLLTSLQVCADARSRWPGATVALVLHKSHVCDFGSQVCLRATRDISDPCSGLVERGFALYHTRLYRNSPDKRHHMEEDPAADALMAAWSTSGPTLFVLALDTCEILGTLAPEAVGSSGHDGEARSEPSSAERLQLLRARILATDGVMERLPAAPLRGWSAAACLAAPAPSILDAWQALEDQAASRTSAPP